MELNNKLAMSHPKLIRGQVWCTKCGRSQRVGAAHCFEHGWPKCCGYTMTLDSPEERKELSANSSSTPKVTHNTPLHRITRTRS